MTLPDFSKIGGFFEEHVEKMVLAVVGVLCAWILITRVILSPNVVLYDGKKVSPTAIDEQIYAKAKLLQQKLNEPPEDLPPYDPKVNKYSALLDSAITGVDVGPVRLAPYPVVGPGGPGGGVYSLPRIGEVNDVDVEHIQTVAYVPINVVTEEKPYDKGNNEPNDLDFVTVEAKFDVAGLYARFREMVEDVAPEYADPCLAKPVFAAVQLQRQELGADGTWGPWQNVPRPKIDPYKRLFQIVERVQDLPPGGFKVQLIQFDNKQVQIDLLQPEAYQIASADEEWFPPALHRKFQDIQRKISTEEKMQAKEKEKQDQTRTTSSTDNRTNRRPTRTRGGAAGDAYGGAGDTYGGAGADGRPRGARGRDRTGQQGQLPGDTGRLSDRRGPRGRTGTDGTDQLYDMGMDGLGLGTTDPKAALRKPSVNQVYIKFDEIRLTWMTDFAKLREPLVFWAHDDTVGPAKTYRYRIRLGVFNPLAGTNQLSEKDKAMKDQVILWSDFSAVTKPVEIMGRLYFFANSVREMDKAVTVQVSKLALGRWYSHDFVVRQGEQIGNVIEPEPEKPDRNALGTTVPGVTPLGTMMGGPPGMPMGRVPGPGVSLPQDKSNIPETVDCTTGAVMVDAVVVNDWSGAPALRARNYHDMLYSYDGISIEHMPIGSTYWEPQLQSVFSHIARKQREPREPFKAFGTSSRQQRMGDGMDEYYDMGNEMMMEDMPMMGGRPLY
jgi:hypothetical protein